MVPMGFHEARHTYISWLVASGWVVHSVLLQRGLQHFENDRLEPNL
jgi:hypothetical protein